MRGSSPRMTRNKTMPMIDADGCLLNVSVEGRDGGPTLMLSNSLGSTMAMWEPQMKALTEGGIAGVADAVMTNWLTADFREREPQVTANLKAMMLTTPVEGYIACCEALSTLDNRELLPKIKSPTLVIAGRHDMSTPVAAGELIRSQIPGASMMILDAAHISNIEQPHAFTDAVVGFLTQ